MTMPYFAVVTFLPTSATLQKRPGTGVAACAGTADMPMLRMVMAAAVAKMRFKIPPRFETILAENLTANLTGNLIPLTKDHYSP